jgi:hypothetical protein
MTACDRDVLDPLIDAATVGSTFWRIGDARKYLQLAASAIRLVGVPTLMSIPGDERLAITVPGVVRRGGLADAGLLTVTEQRVVLAWCTGPIPVRDFVEVLPLRSISSIRVTLYRVGVRKGWRTRFHIAGPRADWTFEQHDDRDGSVGRATQGFLEGWITLTDPG